MLVASYRDMGSALRGYRAFSELAGLANGFALDQFDDVVLVRDAGLWAPSRGIFAATMDGLRLMDGRRIAWLATDEMSPAEATNSVHTISEVGCSEIDVLVKKGTVTDKEGNEVEISAEVPGYHANLVAYGWLAEMLTSGTPTEGTLFERTCILDRLGDMD